jgi:hypothetical protein
MPGSGSEECPGRGRWAGRGERRRGIPGRPGDTTLILPFCTMSWLQRPRCARPLWLVAAWPWNAMDHGRWTIDDSRLREQLAMYTVSSALGAPADCAQNYGVLDPLQGSRPLQGADDLNAKTISRAAASTGGFLRRARREENVVPFDREAACRVAMVGQAKRLERFTLQSLSRKCHALPPAQAASGKALLEGLSKGRCWTRAVWPDSVQVLRS